MKTIPVIPIAKLPLVVNFSCGISKCISSVSFVSIEAGVGVVFGDERADSGKRSRPDSGKRFEWSKIRVSRCNSLSPYFNMIINFKKYLKI